MSEHTQGPWIADDNEGFSGWSIWSGSAPSGYGNGTKIATINGDSEESDANALLIAAAPDLLRAAKDFVEWFECDRIGDKPTAELHYARAAIAKANGEI